MHPEKILIELENGNRILVPAGITPHQLLAEHPEWNPEPALPVLGALVSNEAVTLDYPMEADAGLRFLNLRHPHGERIYRHSIAFLAAACAHRLFPGADFAVEHSLSGGLFCSLNRPEEAEPDPATVRQLEEEMRRLMAEARPVERRRIAYREAVSCFESAKMDDKLNLLRYRNLSKISVYACNGFTDLAHGPLVSNTAALGGFRLQPCDRGFVILYPSRQNPFTVQPFKPSPLITQIYREHKQWGRQAGVSTVGDLNQIIAEHRFDRFVEVCEAFMEKRIVRIAERIAEHRDRLRWIMVAGPSSAGKTTFARRLSVQLRANGIETAQISMDDYFVNRERTPRGTDGSVDYEHLEAVDLALLGEHMIRLEQGEAIELPAFNFENGQRGPSGRILRLGPDHMVIMEGIHGLNPRVATPLNPDRLFRIFVSAITQLNLDRNNRISTTDNRLLRRMVRDSTSRNHNGLETLQMWPTVRAGEKKWIFPFQQEADAFFNSALDYELAVLKPLADPLLAEVKPWHPQYAEARRLQDFLENFLAAPLHRVPPDSLLREFIDGYR